MVQQRRINDELSGKNRILFSAQALEYSGLNLAKGISKEDKEEFARIEKKIQEMKR